MWGYVWVVYVMLGMGLRVVTRENAEGGYVG